MRTNEYESEHEKQDENWVHGCTLGWNPVSNSEGGEGFFAGEVHRRGGRKCTRPRQDRGLLEGLKPYSISWAANRGAFRAEGARFKEPHQENLELDFALQ